MKNVYLLAEFQESIRFSSAMSLITNLNFEDEYPSIHDACIEVLAMEVNMKFRCKCVALDVSLTERFSHH